MSSVKNEIGATPRLWTFCLQATNCEGLAVAGATVMPGDKNVFTSKCIGSLNDLPHVKPMRLKDGGNRRHGSSVTPIVGIQVNRNTESVI